MSFLPKPMLSARHPPDVAYLLSPGIRGSFPLTKWPCLLGSVGAAGKVRPNPKCSVLSLCHPLTYILQAGNGASQKEQSHFNKFTLRKMHLTFLLVGSGT